eukprot:TRINITY_DN2281_c0_g1_i2.p1 TRINITY_DN2281_c0_g1~~TRINITY_DN2281_c0_g1_i2.p1  ORF type:complete len:119 (-),score=26.40 TRINITY_DN2281_c0_g1_i2:368-724(-)
MKTTILVLLVLVLLAISFAPSDAIPCAFYDVCGVCNGDGSSCRCKDYLGFPLEEVDQTVYLSVNEQLQALIQQTIANLRRMRSGLVDVYDPTTKRFATNTFLLRCTYTGFKIGFKQLH